VTLREIRNNDDVELSGFTSSFVHIQVASLTTLLWDDLANNSRKSMERETQFNWK
jgi:hypothetical protein